MIKPLRNVILGTQIIPKMEHGLWMPECLTREADYRVSVAKWFTVHAVGPKVTEIKPGDRVFCRFDNVGLTRLPDGQCLFTQDQVEMVVPNNPTDGVWWCNAHKREATHVGKDGKRECDPKLGGIMLPCDVVLAPAKIEQQEGQ